MIKKIFFVAFICALMGCQKDTVQFDSNEAASTYKQSSYENLPSEVRNILINGGAGHFGCESSNRVPLVLNSGVLGTYAYPYTSNLSPIKLYKSSIPCRPNIPYFIFGHAEGGSKGLNSVTFHLALNPSYSGPVQVFDINWELKGENTSVPFKSFTIDDLQINESRSLTCRVFSTDNNLSVYSQEMTFDFKLLIALGSDPVVEFESGYTYACMNNGIFPIVAP